jgi:hypothetical protein
MLSLMHPALAAARGIELLATADHARAARAARAAAAPDRPAPAEAPAEAAVAIRLARPADARALALLAELDGQEERADRLAHLADSPWEGSVLVAEADGAIAAALAIDDAVVVADPFRRTATLVDLLRLRAEQLTGRSVRAHGLPRLAAAVLHPRLH